jgi:hypothetical protein
MKSRSKDRRKQQRQKGCFGLRGAFDINPQLGSALTLFLSGLDFTAQALRHNIDNPSDELSVSFRGAYGNTLKPHHGILIKPIFSAAMSATPYRKDFYSKLGPDPAKVNTELDNWIKALQKDVGIIQTFLERKDVLGKK